MDGDIGVEEIRETGDQWPTAACPGPERIARSKSKDSIRLCDGASGGFGGLGDGSA